MSESTVILKTDKTRYGLRRPESRERFQHRDQAGRACGLIGPNGSGKTTVFNMLTGVPYVPLEGEIYLMGKRITGMKTHRSS